MADQTEGVHPNLIRRTCGGWLAVSPGGAAFSVGVTATTEEEARDKFCFTYSHWLEIIRDTKNGVIT